MRFIYILFILVAGFISCNKDDDSPSNPTPTPQPVSMENLEGSIFGNDWELVQANGLTIVGIPGENYLHTFYLRNVQDDSLCQRDSDFMPSIRSVDSLICQIDIPSFVSFPELGTYELNSFFIPGTAKFRFIKNSDSTFFSTDSVVGTLEIVTVDALELKVAGWVEASALGDTTTSVEGYFEADICPL